MSPQHLFLQIKNLLLAIKEIKRRDRERSLVMVGPGSFRELNPGEGQTLKQRLDALHHRRNAACKDYAEKYRQIILFNVGDVEVAKEIINHSQFAGVVRTHRSVPSHLYDDIKALCDTKNIVLEHRPAAPVSRGQSRGRYRSHRENRYHNYGAAATGFNDGSGTAQGRDRGRIGYKHHRGRIGYEHHNQESRYGRGGQGRGLGRN